MKKTNYIRKIVEDYCVLDIETTGLSLKYDKVIEIGMLRVRDGKIVDEYSQLINPHRYIDNYITSLTGITNDMVSGMPRIKEVKDDILNFIGDDILLGHHTSFDKNFLDASFDCEISNQYLDTLQFSRALYPYLMNHSLETMAEYLDLSRNSHRALADCITTFELYESIKKTMKEKNLQINDLWKGSNPIKISNIIPKVKRINKNSFFYGKHVAFSGRFRLLPQEEAMQRVVNQGGILDKKVTKKTNYFVFTDRGYDLSQNGEKCPKYQKAKKLKLSGQDINLIIEDDFYILIGKKRKRKRHDICSHKI